MEQYIGEILIAVVLGVFGYKTRKIQTKVISQKERTKVMLEKLIDISHEIKQ